MDIKEPEPRDGKAPEPLVAAPDPPRHPEPRTPPQCAPSPVTLRCPEPLIAALRSPEPFFTVP